MQPKTLYLALCVAGVVIPYWQFFPRIGEHGLKSASIPAAAFCQPRWSLLRHGCCRLGRSLDRLQPDRRWAAGNSPAVDVLAVLTVGVSLGLPVFLYLREMDLEGKPAAT
jgi:hypothetical protein